MHSFDLFHDYEKHRWSLKDLPWDRLDRDRIKPEHLSLIKSMIVGESNSVAGLHGFLNESVEDYDFAAYASLWGAQELQHHFAFRNYLERFDVEISQGVVESMRAPYPPGITHAATLATNVISEITVCHLYNKLSKVLDEPVLCEILRLTSQDEARHARDFIYYTRRRLEAHPGEMASVLETLYVYVGSADKRIKHPVNMMKDLPELRGHETIDGAFDYFEVLGGDSRAKLTKKLFSTFSNLSKRPLTNLASLRRGIADMSEAA